MPIHCSVTHRFHHRHTPNPAKSTDSKGLLHQQYILFAACGALLPTGDLLFAMSKKEVNFYDFALYFKSQGCSNALYLDGLVSRTYLPEKHWMQTDGDFGVIIAVTVNK